ncbi:MAG: endonuclease/exonuclease/phosphatase family protein [Gluconacetobacter diazotrophicus]|nr:endonuclease/exonuclease/phosphatase family protein [Gluconacetobacter diazotrophicus]
MRIVTWNINSLRLRLPLLERLVGELAPDVVCLQETKVPDELFPADAPARLGFPWHLRRGMKGYNGVAILSRLPMREDVQAPDWCLKNDRRHVAAVIEAPTGPLTLHDFYVPAGGDIPDPEQNPKYAHKLAFLDEVTAYFAAIPPGERCVLVGDLNVAPLEHDVWSHRQLRDVVSHTEPEITRLQAWMATGFADAMRHVVPPREKLYTWWSYRNRDWRGSDRGRRLDHVWCTPDLLPFLRGLAVAKEVRDWPTTSDHVPVSIDLAV